MVSRVLRAAFFAGVTAVASTAQADVKFSLSDLFGDRPCVSIGNGQAGARICSDGNGGVRGGAVARTPHGTVRTPIRIEGKRNVFWNNTVFSCPANAKHINNPSIDCDANTAFNGMTLTPVRYGRVTYMCPVRTNLNGIGEAGLGRHCAIAAVAR